MTTTTREKEALLVDAKNLVRMAIVKQRPFLSREDYEELESDCLFAASRAIDEYERAGPAALSTLIFRYCVQARRDFFRPRRRLSEMMEKRGIDVSDESVEAFGAEPDETNERATRHRAIVQTMEITIDMARNDGVLTEREYQVLTMRRQNRTQKEIADEVGISPQMVSIDEQTGVAKIRLAYRTAE